jgi:hypothetical protein
MPKYSRKNRVLRKKYKQKGGEFSDEEINELHDLGFTDEHIQILIDNNLTNIQLARNSLQQINPDTGMNFTPQEIIDSVIQVNDDSLNESNISDDSNESEIHDLGDLDNENDLDFLGDDNDNNYIPNDSMNTTYDEDISMIDNDNENNIDDDYFEPLHLSDLDDDEGNNSNNTSMDQNSFGGKTKKRSKKHRRKTLKKNKKHRRKTLKPIRKMKRGKKRKTMKK